jgi:hypothetical protein
MEHGGVCSIHWQLFQHSRACHHQSATRDADDCLFYHFFNGSISETEFLKEFKIQFEHFDINEKKNSIIKLIYNIILNNKSIDFSLDFSDFVIIEPDRIQSDFYNIQKNNNHNVINKSIFLIIETLLKNEELFFKYYILHYQHIFTNFDIASNPIEIIIERNNKFMIYEGTHRFIICLIKNITPHFIVIKSNCESYDIIMNILKIDYENLYKKYDSNFLIYNRIPHFLFDNYKYIREDRSPHIIRFLKNYKLNNGLEIGPQNGLLSIELSKACYLMTCVEYEKKYFDLTSHTLNFCEINNVKPIYANIYDCIITKFDYDFMVSLSVFYHLKRDDPDKFRSFIINLIEKTKVLIFDDEPNTGLLDLNDIYSYVKSTEYSPEISIIYKGEDNRTIYGLVNKHKL